MTPSPSYSTLCKRIELELATVESRAADLRSALDVIREFEPLAAEVADIEPTKRRLEEMDEIPEAVKSRLAEKVQSARSEEKGIDLHKA